MKWYKTQISNYKSQINPKLQNSNPKQITKDSESYLFGRLWKATFGLISDRKSTSSQVETCFPPFLKGVRGIFWNLEFGYCLLFAVWCLEFFIFNDSTIVRYPVRLFYCICGTLHYGNWVKIRSPVKWNAMLWHWWHSRTFADVMKGFPSGSNLA